MQTKVFVASVLVLFFSFGGFALAQVDTDGDLNADITDPFPGDPLQGGVAGRPGICGLQRSQQIRSDHSRIFRRLATRP